MIPMDRANEWGETYGGGFGLQPGAQLLNVPVELLDPWEDGTGKAQPFRAYSEEKQKQLAENIRQNGIITPLRVRPMGRRFQILAGHNRCAGAKAVGLTTVPAIVEAVDDDRAAIILVDSNLEQRDELLPSEKAFAYKLKMEAMSRQGKRTDLTSGQIGPKLRTDEMIAQDSSDSARQIKRYIRLTYLLPTLLDMVDAGKVKLIAGVELSFLPLNVQEILLRLMLEGDVKLTTAKAKLLHEVMPETEEQLRALLADKPKRKPLTLALELPGLTEAQLAQLNSSEDFQRSLLDYAAKLAREYLEDDHDWSDQSPV